jgi:hypothetical protein
VSDDWFSENVMLASGVSGAGKTGKGKRTLSLRYSEGKRPQNTKPRPGTGRGDVKGEQERKENKKNKRKRKERK